MTTKDLLNLDPDAINRMSRKELAKVVSQMAATANKRLQRLSETDIGQLSPAYTRTQSRAYTTAKGGRFGTKGKTLNQLRNEYKAAKSFLESKTGSVKGWEATREKTYERIGGGFNGDVDLEKDFWIGYRRFESLHPEIIGSGSTEVQRYMRSELTRDVPLDEAIVNASTYLNDIYKEDVENYDFGDEWWE